MLKAAPRQTAAQVILLAADDLMAQGFSEFSEWDLTLAAWDRDRARFGLRGHGQKHPDHKRVMMEIMGRKPHNPLLLGLMEKVRPNYYRLTPLGRAEALRLRTGQEVAAGKKKPTALDHYDTLSRHVKHPVFQRWRDDPDEPRRFTDVSSFLDATDAASTVEGYHRLGKVLKAAIEWCSKHDTDYLTKDPPRVHPPIHFRELAELSDFLQALAYRFPQLEHPKGVPPKG